MMYTVQYFDEATQDDATIFTGTLEECRAYCEDAFSEEYDLYEQEPLFIVAPDGFTVIENFL